MVVAVVISRTISLPLVWHLFPVLVEMLVPIQRRRIKHTMKTVGEVTVNKSMAVPCVNPVLPIINNMPLWNLQGHGIFLRIVVDRMVLVRDGPNSIGMPVGKSSQVKLFSVIL